MNFETIVFAIENGVERLTLNRPDKLNSFNVAMHLEVREALKRLASAEDARVLVLTGAGRGFCAGQDLADRAVAPGAAAVDLGESVQKFYAPLVLALRGLPMPVLCAVNGVAAGAGANLAFACDIVIAANVVHATESLSATLGNVKRLMTSQGMLLIVEAVNAPHWVDISFGTTEGWWKFTDHELRPSSPLLSEATWRDFLPTAGFEHVQIFSDMSTPQESGHPVIVARVS